MDDNINNCLSESGNTDSEHTDMKERAELSDTPVRDEVIEDNDNESPRNENEEEGDMKDSLGMRLWTNDLIMREIMSHLDWRDLLRCELVCRLWRDVVKSLQRSSSLRSYDFAMDRYTFLDNGVDCIKYDLVVSDMPVQTQPMCAFCFHNKRILPFWVPCEDFSPVPCDPPCGSRHHVIEAVSNIMLSKRTSLLAVYEAYLIYKPLPASCTFQYTIHDMERDCAPFLTGLYLPKMPNVNYRTIQYCTRQTAQKDFYRVVDGICTTDIIKGVVVFVELNLPIKRKIPGLLNYVKNKQRNVPFALGGAIADQVSYTGIATGRDVRARLSMGVFSVPKEPAPEPEPRCQFKMHSLIIDSTVRERAAIQQVIETFAENITELEYSAALELSSYKRHASHAVEQELFRASFPRAAVLGCCSSRAIIGSGHPEPDLRPLPTKRSMWWSDDDEQEFMHPTSTVFVLFSWGKQLEETQHSTQ